LASKFTKRSPEMLPDCAPIPWAVWHTEQENPSCLMWRACSLKLLLFVICARSWHLAHKAYGPPLAPPSALKVGFGNRFVTGLPGSGA